MGSEARGCFPPPSAPRLPPVSRRRSRARPPPGPCVRSPCVFAPRSADDADDGTDGGDGRRRENTPVQIGCTKRAPPTMLLITTQLKILVNNHLPQYWHHSGGPAICHLYYWTTVLLLSCQTIVRTK